MCEIETLTVLPLAAAAIEGARTTVGPVGVDLIVVQEKEETRQPRESGQERRGRLDGDTDLISISLSEAPAPLDSTPRLLKTASLAAHLPANDARASGCAAQ